MKTAFFRHFVVALTLLTFATANAAQLGDSAAPLKISEWIKGKPVDLDQTRSNHIVVVEFWATWGPPCRASIPHLTELQKQFKDVIFVGISDEDSDTVKKFVAKMGDKMDYTVALDDNDKTSDGYMKAFERGGIPHAFVVDKQGRVVWEGHPMAGLDKALSEIQSGTYNMEREKKRAEMESGIEKFYELASTSTQDSEELTALGKRLEALDAEIGGYQPEKPFKSDEIIKKVRFQKLVGDYQRALVTGKSDSTLDDLAEQLAKQAPAEFDLKEFKADALAQKAFGEYYRALIVGEKDEKVAALSEKVLASRSNNAGSLNEMAWALLTDERIKKRDYKLALTLAKAAVDASDSKEPSALDTYARALYDSGNTSDAIAWQTKAVAAATSDEMRQELQESLTRYQAGKK